MDELLFTPSGVLDILSNIDELKEYEVGVSENNDNIEITVGQSKYTVKGAQDVQVDTNAVKEIAEINESAYDELSDSYISEPVESGIIRQLVKTLLVGGMVRLTSKLLRK